MNQDTERNVQMNQMNQTNQIECNGINSSTIRANTIIKAIMLIIDIILPNEELNNKAFKVKQKLRINLMDNIHAIVRENEK